MAVQGVYFCCYSCYVLMKFSLHNEPALFLSLLSISHLVKNINYFEFFSFAEFSFFSEQVNKMRFDNIFKVFDYFQ